MSQEIFKTLGNELREAREKKELSIEQLFAKTRIDKKFLTAIEEGNFSLLPEVYIKAFVKEYAKTVGLDEKETMAKYNSAKKGESYDTQTTVTEKTDNVSKKNEIEKKIEESNRLDSEKSVPDETPQSKKTMIYIAVAVVLILAIFLIYNNFLKEENQQIVAEKPFEEILEEKNKNDDATQSNTQTGQSEKNTPVKVNSSKVKIESDKISPKKIELVKEPEKINPKTETVKPYNSGKLVLKIVGSEKSWIRVVADEKENTEFILDNGITREVTASNKFYLHIGNSGGLKLFLNNKELNFVGTTGKVRKITVTTDGIKYLSKTPAFDAAQE